MIAHHTWCHALATMNACTPIESFEASKLFNDLETPKQQMLKVVSKTEEKMELTREQCAMIFYYFKAGLNQDECVQRLQLAFGDESPCRATVFR
ncbi:hypothetical protein TNCV_988581 [Trichonephila clavipes]|nr:hypothetical protein TNCV_988581 [Trichonephila clavipes]